MRPAPLYSALMESTEEITEEPHSGLECAISLESIIEYKSGPPGGI